VKLALFFTIVVTGVAGCGGSSDPNAKALHQAELATRAFDRAIGIETAFVSDGNIDIEATPAIIANAMLNRVESEGSGCVVATSSDNTLHADFGTSCELATASMHIGGTVDGEVDPDPTTGGVTITLTLAVTVDDNEALSGALIVSTPDGTVFSYAAPDGLTLDGTVVASPLVAAGIAAGGATLDAANGTVDGATLVFTGMHERFAACYPDDGSATVNAVEVDFASNTPEDGKVMVGSGSGATLPKRARCPN
jgi:hypothetical protein